MASFPFFVSSPASPPSPFWAAASPGRSPARSSSWTTRAIPIAVRIPATRVVSLIPASTELLFAIGAGAGRGGAHRVV